MVSQRACCAPAYFPFVELSKGPQSTMTLDEKEPRTIDTEEIGQGIYCRALRTPDDPLQNELRKMPSAIEIQVIEAFLRLSDRVKATVADGLSLGLLRSEEDTFARDRIEKVEQTDHSITKGSWTTEFVKRKSWSRATQIVLWRVGETEEYATVTELFRNGSPLSEDHVTNLLKRFAASLAYKFLECTDESLRQAHFEALLSQALKHLRDDPSVYTSEVRLRGLFVPAEPVKLQIDATEFLLRRPTEEDFAHEEFYFGFREHFKEDPTAVLHIKFSGTARNETQRKVWKSVTILRLFKVGGVRYISHKDDSESLIDTLGSGTLTAGRAHVTHTSYVIEAADVLRLEQFWQRMNDVVPAGGYGDGTAHVDPIEIAYQRYSDALLTFGATVERRIADSVMGLESLLLRGSENQELTYRLSLRVARILGSLSRNPRDAQAVATDAYSVRSAFVHGDVVSHKKKRPIEKKHGNLENLLKSALDQLRIAIVVFSTIGVSKDDFISIVDDAFINPTSRRELRRLLVPLRTLI